MVPLRTKKFESHVAAKEDAAVTARRFMHTVAVLWVGIGPQQVKEDVVIVRLWRFRALPSVRQVAQLGQCHPVYRVSTQKISYEYVCGETCFSVRAASRTGM